MDQTEYQITDRISFQRFLGLSLGEKVPDAKTIWLFRNTLTEADIIEKLFAQFNRMLEEQGIITHKGTIVDATFVDAPRQRNTRDENEQIKDGKIPDEWKKKPQKLAQKDTDPRWTKKGDETHFGHKDHAKVDADNKLLTDYVVTPPMYTTVTNLKISSMNSMRSDMPIVPMLARIYRSMSKTRFVRKGIAINR